MTETIDGANAAASTLFLGHNGEWWDFWLIISVVFAALAAIAIGITTTGSLVSLKREASAAEATLEKYKLETEDKISDSTARAAEAKLQLENLRKRVGPRIIDRSVFGNMLKDGPIASVEIEYGAEDQDSWILAIQIRALLQQSGWTVTALVSQPVTKVIQKAPIVPANIQVLARNISQEETESVMNQTAGEVPDAKTPYVFLTAAIMRGLDRGCVGGVDPTLPEKHLRLVIFPR
jgi:hypothetical protein